MIGAMFLVKHTASSIEKTSDGDAREAKEAAQKVQEGNKDIISLMLNNMSELREYYVINKRQANRVFNATLTACVMYFAPYSPVAFLCDTLSCYQSASFQ